ncbi:MAG: primosomal protein N' [Clostridia bacterium]|nr:primosomal protein N' [Clostridia bacterium]
MIYEVIVDLATNDLDRTFDYFGDDISLGSRVVVEFGRKKMVGFVIGEKETTQYPDKIKPIVKVLDTPIVSEMLELMHFMKKKYNLRFIDALRLFVPSKMRSDATCELQRVFITINNDIDVAASIEKLSARAEKQRETLEYLARGEGEYQSELSKKFGAGAVSALIEKGILKSEKVSVRRTPFSNFSCEDVLHKLTKDQLNAVKAVASGSGVFLLHGVTGSGKTEVYQTIIDKVLTENKTAIMLVPEISLTPQIFKLFRARFGEKIAILHSGLSEGERFDEWSRLYDGEAKIAIGARSAIFAPLKNVGLIIIDEEHDSSYISDSNPRYDTKVVAKFRAEFNNAPLLLGSATPEIESYMKASSGEYNLLTLPDRIAKFQQKDIEIVDMGSEFRNGNRNILSGALVDALRTIIDRGEQAILFLNRRGFSSFLMCKECGYIPKCDACDVNLTYHRAVARLKCHYCGKNYTVPNKCPKCGSEHIRFGRTGTEQVVNYIHELFPETKVLRMDVDTTSSKGAHFRILDDFGKGKAQILVGTQMIAKGHDFPNVTLVGILDVDFSLFLDDYRASERTFQLVTQVAGRAGRADKEGKVLLQTFVPTHYVFRLAKKYDYNGFFEKEINSRQVTKFPPFTTIVRILFTSENDELAFSETKKIYQILKEESVKNKDFVYINAMRSPVNKIKNKTRYQILLRVYPGNADSIIEHIYQLVATVTNEIQCFVEINPQSLN